MTETEGTRLAYIRDVAPIKLDAELTKNPVVFDKKVTWTKVKKRMMEVVQKHFLIPKH